MKRTFCLPLLAACGISLFMIPIAFAQSDDECKEKPFTYDDGPLGQPHWCGECNEEGRTRQAPINIKSDAQRVGSLPRLSFSGYGATKLAVDKKYHNLKVDYSAGSSFITIGTIRFKLAEFHFHTPSEETIDGDHFAMVIHLVHDKATPNGPTPVVAILVTTEGTPRENTRKLVDKLIENAPVVNGKVAPREEEINAADLLPPTENNQPLGYYRYEGSLTTPGCKEGVTFYVLKTPVVFSQDQIEKFKARYPFPNARNIQTTNTSKVEQTVY